MDGHSDRKGEQDAPTTGGSGWSWGGWGSSAFSVLSDLQKVAEEVSKNAVAAAKVGMSGLQNSLVQEDEDENGDYVALQGGEDLDRDNAPALLEPVAGLDEKLRATSLEKLEGAGQESFLGHSLKVIDTSVESLTAGAFQALESAWKGGFNLVHKIEASAEQLAGSIQQTGTEFTAKAGTLAPQLIQSSKAFTAKGMHFVEVVGRETMEMLATETGIELEEDGKDSETEAQGDDEEYAEDVTFERCFYIYGGPEQLEELEALSNHHSLLCNRARAKLSGEQKASFDSLLKQLEQTLSVGDNKELVSGASKGKSVHLEAASNRSEVKALREASVTKAAEMATGFGASLGGLALTEVFQKTTDRLEAIRAEGVHRVSELCALCISHLLHLGNSVLAAHPDEQGKTGQSVDDVDWPVDCRGKAVVLEAEAQAMVSDIQVVSDCFVTGVGDVVAAFLASIQSDLVMAKGDVSQDVPKDGLIEGRAAAVSEELKSQSRAAAQKVQDGLKHLTWVVLWTSLKF